MWLKGQVNPKGLFSLIFNNNYQSKWVKSVQGYLGKIGLSPQALISSGIEQAKQIVKQRIEDNEYQTDLSSIQNMTARTYIKNCMEPAKYLTSLEMKGTRRAFTVARCLALPSAVLEGKYKNTPFAERLCS